MRSPPGSNAEEYGAIVVVIRSTLRIAQRDRAGELPGNFSEGRALQERFLATLGECCRKTLWQVRSFCLMTNHFHLVIETRSPSPVEGMKWFLGVYTRRFNLRHKLLGHLFSGSKARMVRGFRAVSGRDAAVYRSPSREVALRGRTGGIVSGKSRAHYRRGVEQRRGSSRAALWLGQGACG